MGLSFKCPVTTYRHSAVLYVSLHICCSGWFKHVALKTTMTNTTAITSIINHQSLLQNVITELIRTLADIMSRTPASTTLLVSLWNIRACGSNPYIPILVPTRCPTPDLLGAAHFFEGRCIAVSIRKESRVLDGGKAMRVCATPYPCQKILGAMGLAKPIAPQPLAHGQCPLPRRPIGGPFR